MKLQCYAIDEYFNKKYAYVHVYMDVSIICLHGDNCMYTWICMQAYMHK